MLYHFNTLSHYSRKDIRFSLYVRVTFQAEAVVTIQTAVESAGVENLYQLEAVGWHTYMYASSHLHRT